MDSTEFKLLHKKLSKTQRQMAQLLGTSIKAIHSYEQGWRSIPHHVERQMFFLIFKLTGKGSSKKPCWKIKKCPAEFKEQCPAWEFKTGELCWFISGTICDGVVHENWKEKMKICRTCKIFKNLLEEIAE